MSLDIGALNLRLEAPSHRRAAAERFGADLRAALPGALAEALAPYAALPGVAIVPRLRVNAAVAFGTANARAAARRIAASCVEAIVAESATLGSSPSDRSAGTAERTLRALPVLDGVRIDAATEAAAWLVALARDERSVVRRVSPYADLERVTSGAAFAAICERAGARAVIAALGPGWAYRLALRCTAFDATRLLALLDDGAEPAAATWLALRTFRDELRAVADVCAPGVGESESARGIPAGFDPALVRELTRHLRGRDDLIATTPDSVLALIVALHGVFGGEPGVVGAARALTAPARSTAVDVAVSRAPSVPIASPEESVACACAGFWLLLPHLARRLAGFAEDDARGIALRIAERLFGNDARSDPAVLALTDGRDQDGLRARVPDAVRVDRLAVAIVRDFARTLLRFERARPWYVVRAMLTGPALLRHAPDGYAATLPQSPVRVVLERAALLGPVLAPWDEPHLTIVRDE